MGDVAPLPNSLIAGISTRLERMPPAPMTNAMRVPMMYPTPISSGPTSNSRFPPSYPLPKIFCGVSLKKPSALYPKAKRAPKPSPANTVLAVMQPVSQEMSTAAQRDHQQDPEQSAQDADQDHLRHLEFVFKDPATTHIYTLSLHDALPRAP